MALIRSLNTAVSGLKAQQLRIETVGNNIANVDTPAFKSARTEFSTILSQTMSFGQAPDGNLGGIDPTQVGLGAFVGATPRNFSQGPVKATGVASNLAIVGDGFFIVKDAAGNAVFTRNGSFSINPANQLHDPVTGYIVQGYQVPADSLASGDIDLTRLAQGSAVSDIEIPVGVFTIAKATTIATLEGNLNSSGQVSSGGTQYYSQVLYDISKTNSDPISAANPLGLDRATAGSRLQDLVRSLGDFTPFDSSTAGSAGAYARVFPQLQQSPVGLNIQFASAKGDRNLPTTGFVVGDPPPSGGVTLGDLVGFLRNSLGIADGVTGGYREVEQTYSYARVNPVTGEEVNGTIGAGDTANLGTLTDLNSDFRGVRAGDYLRFVSGQASGQIAEIQSVSDSNADGIADTLTFRTDGFNSLSQTPAIGDAYTIQAPAGVRIAADNVMANLSSATVAGFTVGSVSTSGAISSFDLTADPSLDLAVTSGLRADQIVEYQSGGNTVRGVISAVNGNVATVSFLSTESRDPDSGTSFTVLQPASGSIEIGGNVGGANDLHDLQVTAGGSLAPLFEGGATVKATGESVSTTLTAYDSLGTPRDVILTLVYQSSSPNGPNTFRYYAESADDSDRYRLVGTGIVQFDARGQYLGTGSTAEDVNIDLATTDTSAGGVVSPFQFRLDFSRLTQLSSDSSQVVLRDQDGFRSGTLRDYSVDANGTIQGIFDNGLARPLGQIALARFANPNGLEELGNTLYRSSTNSGIPQVGTPGTFGKGIVRGGFLEESNVDLAEQFTELIVGQRAFQANAKTVSTSDQLLQELLNIL